MSESSYLISPISPIKPFESKIADVYINTYDVGKNEVQFELYRGEKPVIKSSSWSFEVVPLPSLEIKVGLLPKVVSTDEDFELQIFDQYEQLVFRKSNVKIKNSKGMIDEVENIALERPYRLVILKKYYLPRQTYLNFKKNENNASFKAMLPVDFSGDGALKWNDFGALFTDLRRFDLLLPW